MIYIFHDTVKNLTSAFSIIDQIVDDLFADSAICWVD